MNVPKNFGYLNNEVINVNGIKFRIEVDATENGSLYIFGEDASGLFYDVLWFNINWNESNFSVVKCKHGMGNSGAQVVMNEPISKKHTITKTTFIDKVIKETVDYLMNNRLY